MSSPVRADTGHAFAEPLAAQDDPGLVDAIVFSKDRPLQLDATLNSLRRRCVDPERLRVQVLYRASTSFMRNLYDTLLSEHLDVQFVYECAFKRDLVRMSSRATFLMPLVDDAIFIRDFSVHDAIIALESDTGAVGFSLRLGPNTSYCYPLDRDQAQPSFEPSPRDGTLAFDWTTGDGDFGYPLEVSSSIYRAADIATLLRDLPYRNPNSLEDQMAARAISFREEKPRLLTFGASVAFCAPVNTVQSMNANRAGTSPGMTVNSLARMFYAGRRLDVDAYAGLTPRSAHQEVALHLIDAERPRPKVSVVVPCYRQAQYLDEAITSIVAQSLTDWELVVVNDGSPDDTSDVVRRAIASYPERRIRLIETPNRGVASARNTGIEASDGWMILPLDADDLVAPSMLERTVEALEHDWTAAIAYTDVDHFGSENRQVRMNEYNFERLCFRNQMSYCSLFRRHAWRDSGGYNSNMIEGDEDWDFWLACGEIGAHGVRVPGHLFRYRIGPGTRHVEAMRHKSSLRARIRGNHPSLYTARRRLIRVPRILPAVLRGRIGRLASRARPMPRPGA